MGLWPFGRKKSRKASHGGADISPFERVSMQHAGTVLDARGQNDLDAAGPERRRSRRDKKRRSSRESKKLKRNPERQRTYSFSPGRNDDIQVARDTHRPPVPELPAHLKAKPGRSNTERQPSVSVGPKPTRASTQPPESSYEWQRMPTLHKRSAQDLARRKSSKKRKEDHQREEEIKAMTAFMPKRPAAEHSSSGRLVKRDSKRVRSGLNRSLQNPSSDISLPTVDSMQTSLSGASDHQTSYILSAFDMLAPRPTIKYAENPRYTPGATGFGSDSTESRRRRVSDRMTLDQEVLKANRRIDELADDLSAGELRELMERDQKRRDKKKMAERMKMEKKIARKQEKQTAGDQIAVRDGTPPPVNMERGVMGRDVVGLGIGNSAVVTSSKRKSSSESDNGRANRPAQLRQDLDLERPVAQFHRTDSLRSENPTLSSEREDPVLDVAKVGTVGKAQVSPPLPAKQHQRGQSSISQMMDLNQPEPKLESEPPIPVAAVPITAPLRKEPSRRSSENSSVRGGRVSQSWTSFFRRSRTNKANKRDSAPSSFSNTSRDSMQNTSFSQNAYTQKPNPNMPKRTMSKFREDLPELPLSPPYSRVQSPEADVVPPIRGYPEKKALRSTDDLRVRYDTPNSGYRSLEAARTRDETPTTGHRVDAPSPEPTAILSQSLASIDSEGSWLSGGKSGSKRGSSQLAQHPTVPLHDSANALQRRYEEYSESAEELGLAEDEYFSRLTPGPEEQYKIHRISTGNPMPSSDEEDGGSLASPVSEKSKWGAVARTPTVVHREPRAKSREGLLNDFDDDSSSRATSMTASMTAGPDSPITPKRKSFGLTQDVIDENEQPGVSRATSVEYRSAGGHTRHISAGSARLLDLGSKEEKKD
jgi:hypothetical protein